MSAPVVHFEIGCRDAERGKKFYGDLFGWNFQAYGAAAMITNISREQGISGHINSLGHEPHNYVTVYAQVDDLQASLNKAKGLGGKTVVPPQEVPGMGSFAWLSDPEGNIVGLWKPLKANPV
jgi:predicted enzyme related to lactoylglutathione lyase